MPGSVLTKVDRASMAHGLEVRPPMLDNEMIDWAFALPSEYKVRGVRGKHLLKMAASGRIPAEVVERPKALGSFCAGPLVPSKPNGRHFAAERAP
jgi:asparagine synthase (glutamine-hydrolysing)